MRDEHCRHVVQKSIKFAQQTPFGKLVKSGGIERGAHVWAPQTWGSFLEWAAPDVKVALDSRIELFPPPLLADADEIASASAGWLTTLDVRKVDALIVRSGSEGARELSDLHGSTPWQMLYEDDDGSIWQRVTISPGG